MAVIDRKIAQRRRDSQFRIGFVSTGHRGRGPRLFGLEGPVNIMQIDPVAIAEGEGRQGMGLGRALLMEGFRRMAERGVTRSFMGSGNEFYRKVGFKDTPYAYSPWIKY